MGNGVIAFKPPPPPPKPPPTQREQLQAIQRQSELNLDAARVTIRQTTAMLSGLPDRSNPRQRDRDDTSDRIVVNEMRRTLDDGHFGWWLVQHEQTRQARNRYRDAVRDLDKAAKDYEKAARRFLNNPTAKNHTRAGVVKADLDEAQRAVEAERKKLRQQLFREIEAKNDGHVPCGEDAAEWCVSGDKCAEIYCPEGDCECSLENLGGGKWNPKKQQELRDKAKAEKAAGGAAKAGDAAAGAGGGDGGGGGAGAAGGGGGGPAAGADAGPRQEPVVPYDSAESAPPPVKSPPAEVPDGTKPTGVGAGAGLAASPDGSAQPQVPPPVQPSKSVAKTTTDPCLPYWTSAKNVLTSLYASRRAGAAPRPTLKERTLVCVVADEAMRSDFQKLYQKDAAGLGGATDCVRVEVASAAGASGEAVERNAARDERPVLIFCGADRDRVMQILGDRNYRYEGARDDAVISVVDGEASWAAAIDELNKHGIKAHAGTRASASGKRCLILIGPRGYAVEVGWVETGSQPAQPEPEFGTPEWDAAARKKRQDFIDKHRQSMPPGEFAEWLRRFEEGERRFLEEMRERHRPRTAAERYGAAAGTIGQGVLKWLWRLLGAAFGLGFRIGTGRIEVLTGDSSIDDYLAPIYEALLEIDYSDLSAFQKFVLELMLEALEGAENPAATFGDAAVGVVKAPFQLPSLIRAALDGDEVAVLTLLIIAASIGARTKVRRKIMGVVRSITPRAAAALRRLGATAKDVLDALSGRRSKVRVSTDGQGNITDVSAAGEGPPPTTSAAQPPDSVPTTLGETKARTPAGGGSGGPEPGGGPRKAGASQGPTHPPGAGSAPDGRTKVPPGTAGGSGDPHDPPKRPTARGSEGEGAGGGEREGRDRAAAASGRGPIIDAPSVRSELARLDPGKTRGFKVVHSEAEMQDLFQRLTAAGKPVTGTSFPGRVVELPDGTTIKFRSFSKTSKLGGSAMEIYYPGRTRRVEVHVQ